jgi:long-chain acyl-CoA synthetase
MAPLSDSPSQNALQDVFIACKHNQEFCVFMSNEGAAGDQLSVDIAPQKFEQPVFQVVSSGTTGEPRTIRRTHLSWIRSFEVNVTMQCISSQDSYGIVGQISHSLPLYAALEAAYSGCDIHLLAELRPDKQLAAISELGTSVLYLTPTQARLLCQAATTTQHTFHVRKVLCGGGKLDTQTIQALQSLFEQADIIEFYGASETSFISICSSDSPADSVGRPYPGVAIKIIGDFGEPTEGQGEIWVSSPYCFKEYVSGNAGDTREDDGFISIGELGYFDTDGNLYLSGRKSRMVNIADNIVFPEEIESWFKDQPVVRQCVVVAKADELRGNVLVAVVQGVNDESARNQLLKECRGALGTLKCPKHILNTNKIPMLNAGKPDVIAVEAWANSHD